MEKYGFVYIWRDRKHNKYYIGCHWGTEDDGYISSCKWMNRAYKRRPEDFKRRILKKIYTSREDLLNEEYYWLRFIDDGELKVKYYNTINKKFNHWSVSERDSVRKTISEKTKEAMWRDDVRTNYIKGMKTRDNKSADPEVRRKRSISMMGKNVGKKRTEESKRKMSKAKMGTKHTEEHIRKKMVGISKLYGYPSCDKKMNVGNLTKHIKICRG